MRKTPGKRSLSSDAYADLMPAAGPAAGKRTRTSARYGSEAAPDASTEGLHPDGLHPAVVSRLQASFGALPHVEVEVAPHKVPDGARAASQGHVIYFRDAEDGSDLGLVAHEVAHVVQAARAGHAAGEGGARDIDLESGAIPTEAREQHDETGRGRRTLEDEANRAAADVEAGRKVAAMSTTPVTEGDMYLKTLPGRVSARSVKLVLFPGEKTLKDGTTIGHIYVYVNGELKKSYEAAAGPPPGEGFADRGGHTAGQTPAGNYVLAHAEHHTTRNWPMSVVPWGAKLREEKGVIEYSSDSGRTWRKASGPDGDVTRAYTLFLERDRAQQARAENQAHAGDRTWKRVKPAPLTAADKAAIEKGAHDALLDDTGALPAEYTKNDFGNWAFDLTQGGHRSAYYIHTTPEDEATTASGGDPDLANSHGCVHIKPADRADMMAHGYLQGGVKLTVKKYGLKGP